MADILHIDAVDMGTLGLTTKNVSGHRDEPRKVWPMRSVPGRSDAVVVSSEPNWEPRKVEVFGTIVGTSHADMMTNRDSLAAAVHTPNEVDISFIDDLTVKLVGRCEGFVVTDVKAGFQSWIARVRIVFVCPDPEYVAV